MDGVKRSELVSVAVPGDYGKPRPALVVQADLFNDTHTSVTVVPVTSTLVDAPLFRLTVEASKANGLRSLSQLMIGKVTTVRRTFRELYRPAGQPCHCSLARDRGVTQRRSHEMRGCNKWAAVAEPE